EQADGEATKHVDGEGRPWKTQRGRRAHGDCDRVARHRADEATQAHPQEIAHLASSIRSGAGLRAAPGAANGSARARRGYPAVSVASLAALPASPAMPGQCPPP